MSVTESDLLTHENKSSSPKQLNRNVTETTLSSFALAFLSTVEIES
jgi:hypothetical protein